MKNNDAKQCSHILQVPLSDCWALNVLISRHL